MDKFNKMLDLIKNEDLCETFVKKNIRSIELIIGLLFNQDQELIDETRKNCHTGRINSLVSLYYGKKPYMGSHFGNERRLCPEGEREWKKRIVTFPDQKY